MPHEVQFVDSVIQAPVKVLGLRLRPYSLGSEILLLRQRNPLIVLSGQQFSVFSPESQSRAVQNAVLVCYRSWAENQKPEKWLKFWLWRIRNLDHGQAAMDFSNYRNAGATFPTGPSEHAMQVLYGDDDAKPARQHGAPFFCRLYNFISGLPDREIRQFGESAWDFPLGLAQFLYLSHLEETGSARIENAKEAEEEKAWREIKADHSPERSFV